MRTASWSCRALISPSKWPCRKTRSLFREILSLTSSSSNSKSRAFTRSTSRWMAGRKGAFRCSSNTRLISSPRAARAENSMAFKDFPEQNNVVQLLRRSLERGRLAHAYLFSGTDLGELEAVARTLAKTLNCEQPPYRTDGGLALDSCDVCGSC